MPIYFREETKEFHLYNDDISYIICVLPNGHIGNLYFGQRVDIDSSYRHLLNTENRSQTTYVYEGDLSFTLQHTRQEYAAHGTGDFCLPAFEIEQEDGSKLSHFQFESYQIKKGKEKLEGLPATYVEDEADADSLELYLYDHVSQTKLTLTYTIFADQAVVTRHAKFYQDGEKTVRLNRALSMTLDFPDKDYEWLHLDGAWGRERHVQTSPLHQGVQSIYSLKGASSAEHNPFIALKRLDATDHVGEAIGFSLIYSGNFLAQVDVTAFQQTRVSMGIHPERFSWELQPGHSFQTPEVVIAYSQGGWNGLSQTYHKLYNHHLIRGAWKLKERPVLLNNWEATSFDFTEEKIVQLAQKSAELGAELFVLDDGWFGQRNHDHAGLGDWTVNYDKLPEGLTGLIEKVHGMGIKFGLWIEPEMVNKDSDLYRAHPDWIIHHPKHSQSHGRHQYTLNLAHEDVYQNIYQQLYTLLSQHDIDYIKWDMNRYMTEVFSVFHQTSQQGEIYHRYMLNVYRLYEALTSAFPHILFESCSSGGSRFDPGILYYAPQTWASDNSDAIERLKIQYGTTMVYPQSTMGCHVSETPNQQVGRMTPIETRANVAYFGCFGYELDLFDLTEEERESVKQQIVFYKEHRRTFQYGTFTRLLSPFGNDNVAWQVVSEDGNQCFVGYYRVLVTANVSTTYLKLKGLDKEAKYEVKGKGIFSGATLIHIGLKIEDDDFPDGFKDFTSRLYDIRKL